MRSDTVLAARGLSKRFPTRAGELAVLDGLELELSRGEMAAVIGHSGVGKTTLLYLLAGLDHSTAGEVFFDGAPLSALTPDQLAEHRNRRVGFVWQLSNLLGDFTARENIELPLLVRGESQREATQAADALLSEVGLAERADHLAGELSGGEQQRVALARALVTRPAVLLADEPTGNLDEQTSEEIFALLARLHHSHGLTSLLATHNLSLAGRCDRAWRLEHGRLTPTARQTGAASETGGAAG